MNMADRFQPGGKGVIATASRDGIPNTAIYAAPHVIDESTVAWGMTSGRTHANLVENPNAAYLYMAPGDANRGLRMTLSLKEILENDPMLHAIRERTRDAVSHEAGDSIRYVAYFHVVEIRPLV